MAAIFDFWQTQTAEYIPTSLSVLPDPENMGIAVGIYLLSCIRWDMCNYIISAAILNFWIPVSSSSVPNSAIEKFDPKNMGIAVGIWSKLV